MTQLLSLSDLDILLPELLLEIRRIVTKCFTGSLLSLFSF